MAITNAQQARQLQQDGGPMRKIKGQDHMLAYITPNEADKLVKLGGQETMTPEGILAYPEFDNYSGANTPGGAMSKSDFEGGAYGGTGNAGDGVINQYSDQINEAIRKEEIAKRALEEFAKREKERKDRAIKTAQDIEKEKVMDRRKKMGAKYVTDMFDLPADYDEEKDDTAAELDLFINDPYREDGTKRSFLPTPVGLGLELFKKPLKAGAKRTRKFFSGPTTDIFGRDQKGVLAAGRFTYDGSPLTTERFNEMSLTEKNKAYDDYMSQRGSNQIDAYGNPIGGNDGGQPIIPLTTAATGITDQEPEEELTELQQMIADRPAYRFMAEGGMTEDAPMDDIMGGMADGNIDEMGRQMYGLGKLVKKATRAVKKVAKSPIGKAVLGYTLTGGLGNLAAGKGFGSFFSGFTNPSSFLGGAGKIFSKGGLQNIASRIGLGGFENVGGNRIFQANKLGSFLSSPGGIITAASMLPLLGLGTGDENENEAQKILDDSGFDLAEVRANPGKYLAPRFAADGGLMRNNYAEGGDAEPVAKKTMPLLDMDGQEMDLRDEGGFVPLGRMERADDVPARLSKNEFVFTADAVRNAGEGDIDKGAEVMYNMMKNLESGGEVSEESQGLDGAREMFKTSQRLEEVL